MLEKEGRSVAVNCQHRWSRKYLGGKDLIEKVHRVSQHTFTQLLYYFTVTILDLACNS